MKAEIQGVKVEGSADEIAVLINKLNNKDEAKINIDFDKEKSPFKKSKPYENQGIFDYINKRDPKNEPTVTLDTDSWAYQFDQLGKEPTLEALAANIGYKTI